MTADAWLAICRRIADRVAHALALHPTTAERSQPVGIGEGGDETLLVDLLAERIVLEELETLAADGTGCILVSEEAGERTIGDASAGWVVVVDPIDGSLNAKRGLPFHCISIAIAQGRTLGDVAVAYVRDLGTGEEWTAIRGAGARLDGRLLEREREGGPFEIVLLEATSPPSRLASATLALDGHTRRVRVLGALALALCQVAGGRADALATLAPTRAVDIAAAQLIAREAGVTLLSLGTDADFAALPLDLARRARICAAADAAAAHRLATLVG